MKSFITTFVFTLKVVYRIFFVLRMAQLFQFIVDRRIGQSFNICQIGKPNPLVYSAIEVNRRILNENLFGSLFTRYMMATATIFLLKLHMSQQPQL